MVEFDLGCTITTDYGIWGIVKYGGGLNSEGQAPGNHYKWREVWAGSSGFCWRPQGEGKSIPDVGGETRGVNLGPRPHQSNVVLEYRFSTFLMLPVPRGVVTPKHKLIFIPPS